MLEQLLVCNSLRRLLVYTDTTQAVAAVLGIQLLLVTAGIVVMPVLTPVLLLLLLLLLQATRGAVVKTLVAAEKMVILVMARAECKVSQNIPCYYAFLRL
jgi:hypothetical protein